MKKLISILVLFAIATTAIFAQSEDNTIPSEDPIEENFVYKMNGKGDQYIKIGIMPNFPLNFGDKLYVGGAAYLGYYRYLNSWLALGGELMAGYNPTIQSNIFTFVPITFGVSFLPTVWKFEFPVTLSLGAAFETSANKKYFPGLVTKAEAGVFYRLSESWSFGLGSDFLYMPQWATSKDKKKNYDYGLFLTAFITARYHF